MIVALVVIYLIYSSWRQRQEPHVVYSSTSEDK